jgi:gas vesicle protein
LELLSEISQSLSIWEEEINMEVSDAMDELEDEVHRFAEKVK